MEDRIKEFLESATTFKPVIEDAGQEKDIFPCITFHIYQEEGAVFGGGKPEIETASCQVDFWYEVKTEEIKQAIKEVKQALSNEKTFTYPLKGHLYENDKGIHHTYFTFNLIKKAGE